MTEDGEERALALGNYLLCLDNLNLPVTEALEKFHALGSRLPEEYFTKAILPQLETYRRRSEFRAGKIETCLAPLALMEFSQAHYFQLWAAALPYVVTRPANIEMEELLEAPRLL